MRQILIDKFFIPKNAFEEFLQRTNYNRDFIRHLPGFVEDAAYQRTDENGNLIFITVAVWENPDVLEKARELVQAEYKRIGFNPAELFARLNIMLDRGTYQEADHPDK